jgi:hypothetical protein
MTREEGVGKVSHQLMQKVFPVPPEEINAESLRTGVGREISCTRNETGRRSL